IVEAVSPQVEGFALVGGQFFDQRSQQSMQLGLFRSNSRIDLAAVGWDKRSQIAPAHRIARIWWAGGRGGLVPPYMPVAPQHVHRPVAADRVQPLGQPIVD